MKRKSSESAKSQVISFAVLVHQQLFKNNLFAQVPSKQSSITDHASLISKKKRTTPIDKKAQTVKPPEVPIVTSVPKGDVVESRELEKGVSCTSESAESELRAFDICTRYGPCSSLTRLQRFERAKRLGLNPPERVGKMLEAFPEKSSESIWHGRL